MDKELLEISRFDAADYLRSDEDINEYLNEAVSENDPRAFLQAVNTIARARGMARLSQETGIPRESLYYSLSEKGNPVYSTLWKVADALGYTVMLKKKSSHEKRAGI